MVSDPGSQLPSLWVFLVIVLGLLIIVIGATSVMMHLVQRRRRNNLRHRVVNGEVDLEALGVKRLTVPRQYLEKLPLYTYSAGPEDAEKTTPQVPAQTRNLPSPTIDAETGQKAAPLSRRPSAPTAPTTITVNGPTFSQSTCPICLDDFEPNECQVRELPCRHIFHVDCIDPFLLSNSSLCPMCKTSVLPVGYCPPRITNVMVRRERMIRRMRARSATTAAATEGQPPPSSTTMSHLPGVLGSLGSRIGGRRFFSAPVTSQSQQTDIEMAGAIPAPTASNPTAGATAAPESAPAAAQTQSSGAAEDSQPPSSSGNRREWARQRAMALLGNRSVPGEAEDDDNTGPRWKRGLRKIFPGFR